MGLAVQRLESIMKYTGIKVLEWGIKTKLQGEWNICMNNWNKHSTFCNLTFRCLYFPLLLS